MIRLFHAEALKFLENSSHYDAIFMDPPDNLGLDYNGFFDKRIDYYEWLRAVIFEAMRHAPVVWISYYWKHDLKVKAFVSSLIGNWDARTFIWRFTFGQYRTTDCANGYRPILRLNRPGIKWTTDKIRIPSKRMLLGDPRAAGPRVPDDVWDFPRVVGNSPERRAWMPTQHPEALLRRIIGMTPGSKWLELFTGSGTMLRVIGMTPGSKWLDTVELSKQTVSKLADEFKISPKTI